MKIRLKLFSLLFFFIATSFVASEDEKLVHPDKIMGGDKFRFLISESNKNLKTEFYYFDGRQTFALFSDPTKKKNNALLVLLPDSGLQKLLYEVNGEKKKLNPTALTFKIGAIDPKTNKFTGKISSILRLGGWFTVKKEDQISLHIKYANGWDEWNLQAKKEANGKWSSRMDHVNTNPEKK